MNKLCVIGGGRWSRVLMNVLLDVLPAHWQILWETKYGQESAANWCVSRNETRIQVVPQIAQSQLKQMSAAIVATAPHTHASHVRRTLVAGVPTFCEKPFVLELAQCQELEQIAIQKNCPLGVNLELTYASYLEDFAHWTRGLVLSRLDIQWTDPWSEERYGETKYGDLYTNIIDDMFPHCWSLLAGITGVRSWELSDVQYLDNSDVYVELVGGGIQASVTLGRRSPRRFRTIQLNRGEASLDFSVEPGIIAMSDQRTVLAWRTARPLTRSTRSFLDVVEGRGDWRAWPLSVVNCRDSVQISVRTAEVLFQRQQQLLKSTAAFTPMSQREFRDRVIFDSCLPLAAQQECRVDFGSEVVVRRFIECVEEQLAKGIEVSALQFMCRGSTDGA